MGRIVAILALAAIASGCCPPCRQPTTAASCEDESSQYEANVAPSGESAEAEDVSRCDIRRRRYELCKKKCEGKDGCDDYCKVKLGECAEGVEPVERADDTETPAAPDTTRPASNDYPSECEMRRTNYQACLRQCSGTPGCASYCQGFLGDC